MWKIKGTNRSPERWILRAEPSERPAQSQNHCESTRERRRRIMVEPHPVQDLNKCVCVCVCACVCVCVCVCCGIPPRKPRPGRARGTVRDGIYHPHPPAGDGEHPFRLPNQGDWWTPGRWQGSHLKRRSRTAQHGTGARRKCSCPGEARGPRRP
jgi:hypothetical protein